VLLVSDVSRRRSTRMSPSLGMFCIVVIQMSAAQCFRMEHSPDSPVFPRSARSGGSCSWYREVGTRVLHPMEPEGEA
jgi:hypothetical protein